MHPFPYDFNTNMKCAYIFKMERFINNCKKKERKKEQKEWKKEQKEREIEKRK